MLRRCLFVLCLAAWAGAAPAARTTEKCVQQPDVVIEWNNVACAAEEANGDGDGPTFGSRAIAMVQAAVFDAINAILPTRQPYALKGYRAPAGASPEAAASQAACLVLTYLHPEQRVVFAAELARQLARVTDLRARLLGVQVGTAAALAIVLLRCNDGANRDVPYQPGFRPGQWRPTPPDYTAALWPQWPCVRPFVLSSGAQFRPGPPPVLTSDAYARAFNEVKLFGAKNSTARTADQTAIAYFWSYDLSPGAPPPALYNEVIQVIALNQGNTLVQNAYLFAIANLAMADGIIACWDTKYYYNFWRPVTGIRLAIQDLNAKTVPDPNWWPLGPPEYPTWTPSFPSYASGHATLGGALFRMLQLYYKTDAIRFTVESEDLPGQPRTYTRLSQADQENKESRIYLGAHWRFDQEAGQNMGHQVAEYVFTHALLPLGGR